MEQQEAFFRAILEEPEDDTPRLVYADWLEEHCQDARAAWIRVSCRLAHVEYGPMFLELRRLEQECFRRCRPAWWENVPGVIQQKNRGLFRFEIQSKTAAARLGKIPWLGDALKEGWLEGISIRWCDDSITRVLAGWKDVAREVPLFVAPAPLIRDEGLAFFLNVPRLWGLDLREEVLQKSSALRLCRRSDLRELKLDGLPSKRKLETFLKQVGHLSELRRLTIKGHNWPTEIDLGLLKGLSGLRELHFDYCIGLTDTCLSHLREFRSLRQLKLSGCKGISEAGVAALCRAMPGLTVDRY